MKKFLGLLLIPIVLLSSCGITKSTTEETNSGYMFIKNINHYVLEPDDKIILSEEEYDGYKKLMDTMLSGKEKVNLTVDKNKIQFLLDLLKQSPYYFFVSSLDAKENEILFEYKFSKEEQKDKLKIMDDKFLEIVNFQADEDDNQLDHMLKIYRYITKNYKYDYSRTDNVQLGSPLFTYPDDEVYNMIIDKKTHCQGFSFMITFTFLQYDIDCFSVYGQCTAHDEGHMWNVFKYDDEYFACDSAWDISENGYSKLFYFGKTDNERLVDTLVPVDFLSYHNKQYGNVECSDERFKLFRNVSRYTVAGKHRYFCETHNKERIFDSEKFDWVE